MAAKLSALWTSRLRQRHWLMVDAAVAAVLVLVGFLDGGGLVFLAAALPVAVRRLWPVPVFGVVLCASVAGTVLHDLPDPYVGLALALYTVAVRLRTRWALAALLAALVTLMVAAGNDPGTLASTITRGHLLIVGACAAGVAIRLQRVAAERQREHDARQAVTEERLRIARELHDVISHGLSLIAIQSGVARYVVDSKPEEAHRALASIEETSRDGLFELRGMLTALRSDDTGADDPLEPAPGLAGLATLTANARTAGIAVTVEVNGTTRRLPSGVDLSAYRIVQEALTNVVKHAAPADATVVLDYRPDTLSIAVTDNGRRKPAHRAGHGLVGMRERAALFGGRLTAGPLDPPGTGFRVTALLPTGTEQA